MLVTMEASGSSGNGPLAFETLVIHGGVEAGNSDGAIIPPISMSAVYDMPDLSVKKHFYSRVSNPTRENFERTLAACSGAQRTFTLEKVTAASIRFPKVYFTGDCLAMASGMAAISATLSLMSAGEHLIAMNDLYSGSQEYITSVCARQGVNVTLIGYIEEIKEVLRENTRIIMCESLSNPMLCLADIPRMVKEIQGRNCILVVDNTFLSPKGLHTLELGADIELHSVTKYINGHSDVVMGAILTNNNFLEGRLRFWQRTAGSAPSPFDCYLASRGLRTLGLRMKEHAANAMIIASFLESSSMVLNVLHMGLDSFPGRALVKQYVKCTGGMISFWIRGGLPAARAFVQNLQVATLAVSLGGVETLVEIPALMTHKALSKHVRDKLGISDNLIRVSVGIESARDLLDDFGAALLAANRLMN